MLFENDIRVHSRTILERYDKLRIALLNRYRERIIAVHPELGYWTCFHHCHNWGNDAARKILAKFNKRYTQIIKRGHNEYEFAK